MKRSTLIVTTLQSWGIGLGCPLPLFVVVYIQVWLPHTYLVMPCSRLYLFPLSPRSFHVRQLLFVLPFYPLDGCFSVVAIYIFQYSTDVNHLRRCSWKRRGGLSSLNCLFFRPPFHFTATTSPSTCARRLPSASSAQYQFFLPSHMYLYLFLDSVRSVPPLHIPFLPPTPFSHPTHPSIAYIIHLLHRPLHSTSHFFSRSVPSHTSVYAPLLLLLNTVVVVIAAVK